LQTEATPTNQVQTAKDHHEGHEEHEGEESQNKTLNLVEDDTGHPKILDFGVARVTDADGKANTFQTRDGQLLGTLPYMSPEQIRGDSTQVDHRSDVYAMGVIAYELLTERLPHDLDGKPVLEAARIVQSDPLTRMSVVDRGFRGDVETMVAKAMEKDPTRRYPSAADFPETSVGT
jgi:serine/threonine protein kinase